MLDLKKPFKLGDWNVEPGRLVIECGGEERHLEPKAMEMLVYLAEHARETVSRDTLGKEIWSGTYGSDEAISRIISLLRSQLGDNTRKPRYIETIPKVGYRLAVYPQPLRRRIRLVPKLSKRAAGVAVLLLVGGYFLSGALLFRGEPQVEPVKTYTVAVLPFEDIGGAETDQLLIVGLTNEIISHLNRSPELRIVARNSLDSRLGSADAAIDYYLEGSIGIVGNRVRVYIDITDAREGIIAWSDSYDTLRADYLAMQRELSRRVMSAFNDELGVEAVLPPELEVSQEAYRAYLNGLFLSKLRGETPLRASIESFTTALEIEPAYDNARVALAHVQALLPYYSRESEVQAFAAASRQLDLLRDSSNAEAEAIRGFIAFRQWYWLNAERHFLDSLALNPDIANTHVWYSQFLSTVGRMEESLQHARIAYELDAVSAVVNDRLATAYLWNNQDQEARRQFTAGSELGFNSLQNPSYLILLLRFKDYDAIRQGLRVLHPATDLGPLLENLEYLEVPEARQNLVDMVGPMIEQGRLIPRLEFGVWIVLQQWNRALATIDKYREQKKNLDFEFLFARESEAFRNDLLFSEVVATLGMDSYWDTAQGPDFR